MSVKSRAVADARMNRAWRSVRALALLGVALLCGSTVGVATGSAAPAYASGGVNVSVEGSPELTFVADPVYQTQLRLNGSGFQSIQNGFGGIYVLFGWVDGPGWAPSSGGVTGENYMYVPDDEANPVGYANFVTFPGSSTSYAANGGEVSADGNWSAVATIPGAQFTAIDRAGNPSEVNCLEVQCGIITIGAHGVVNANNESFTPITFTDLAGAAGTSEAAPAAAPEGGTGTMAAAAPAQTSPKEIIEERTETVVAAAKDTSDEDRLLTILMWAVVGIGVIAVGSVGFLVWAVLSGRKRTREAAAAAAPAPAATPESAPAEVPETAAHSLGSER